MLTNEEIECGVVQSHAKRGRLGPLRSLSFLSDLAGIIAEAKRNFENRDRGINRGFAAGEGRGDGIVMLLSEGFCSKKREGMRDVREAVVGKQDSSVSYITLNGV